MRSGAAEAIHGSSRSRGSRRRTGRWRMRGTYFGECQQAERRSFGYPILPFFAWAPRQSVAPRQEHSEAVTDAQLYLLLGSRIAAGCGGEGIVALAGQVVDP